MNNEKLNGPTSCGLRSKESPMEIDGFVKYSELDAEVTIELFRKVWRMGDRAGATIFFGYAFTTENLFPWLTEEQYSEIHHDNDDDVRTNWDHEHWYAHIALGKTIEEVEALTYQERSAIWKDVGIEVDYWGYRDDPCYMIYPTGAALFTDWDDAADIDIAWFYDTEQIAKWVEKLNKFVEEMKIDLRRTEGIIQVGG